MYVFSWRCTPARRFRNKKTLYKLAVNSARCPEGCYCGVILVFRNWSQYQSWYCSFYNISLNCIIHHQVLARECIPDFTEEFWRSTGILKQPWQPTLVILTPAYLCSKVHQLQALYVLFQCFLFRSSPLQPLFAYLSNIYLKLLRYFYDIIFCFLFLVRLFIILCVRFQQMIRNRIMPKVSSSPSTLIPQYTITQRQKIILIWSVVKEC